MTTTTTNPGLDRMRERVYDGAESVAATLENAAIRIRREAVRARGRSGQQVEDVSAEQYLVDEVLGTVASMQSNLRLDRLVERMVQAEIAAKTTPEIVDLQRRVDAAIAEAERLTQYVTHSPDCAKHPDRAMRPSEVACTCGLNELLGLTPKEN